MKNKTAELNNHLFAVIERLNDEDLTHEELEKEVKRASAIQDVAGAVIDIGQMQIKAMELLARSGVDISEMNELPFGLENGRSGEKTLL